MNYYLESATTQLHFAEYAYLKICSLFYFDATNERVNTFDQL